MGEDNKYYAQNVPEGYYSKERQIKRQKIATWVVMGLVALLIVLGFCSCGTPDPSNREEVESVGKVVKDKRDIFADGTQAPRPSFFLIAEDGSFIQVTMEESFTTNIGDTVYSSNWRK